MQLQIETTNRCEAACVFCSYPSMNRAKGTMPMDLFAKIIEDAATIPPIDKVTLTGLGEPLLDKHLMERFRQVRKHMKVGCLDLYTNGNLLTLDMVREMMGIPVSVIYVSLNAVNERGRMQVMNLDGFNRLESLLDEAIKETKDSDTKIVVKSVIATDLMEPGDGDSFMKRWNGSVEQGGNAFIHLEGNWAGYTFPLRTRLIKPCMRAIDQIMVLWDGRVSLCCFDGEGDVILGDLKVQSIREIYNDGLALKYRGAHMQGRRGELKLCSTCTSI